MAVATVKSIENNEYIPTVWSAGDTVTSAKLNQLENGLAAVSNAMLVVNCQDSTLDKTWNEIFNGNYYFVIAQYKVPNGSKEKTIQFITKVYNENNDYRIQCIYNNSITQVYSTENPDDYPRIHAE